VKSTKLQAAVERVLAGETAGGVARDLGLPSSSLRDAVRAARAARRSTTPSPTPSPTPSSVGTVVDEHPADVLAAEAAEADETLYARAAGGTTEGTPTEADGPAPAAAAAPASPDAVVDIFEGLVGVAVRITVVSKGGDWTERLEASCRFTDAERNRLRATAPYVAQYVGDALASSPYVGIGLFALSALEVCASRFALVKLAVAKPTSSTSSTSSTAEEPPEFEGEPMKPTPSPTIADAPAARGFGE
jgi:hypothetical protein